MRILLGLICCTMLFCISSCTLKNKVGPLTSINQCKNICMQRFQECLPYCVNNCSNCSTSSTKSSTINHDKYVHQQCVQGIIITRELNSYRDPLQCRKVSCNCYADLNTCTQSCTGAIHKKLCSVRNCI